MELRKEPTRTCYAIRSQSNYFSLVFPFTMSQFYSATQVLRQLNAIIPHL